MQTSDVARTIASRFEGHRLRMYVRSKLRSDPVYAAAYETIRDSSLPLLDVGCGVGLLGFYLRERGWDHPIIGVDSDPKKVAVARRIASGYNGLEFRVGESIDGMPFRGNVAIIDVLHYLSDESQIALLESVADMVPKSGFIVIRDCPADGSWRARATWIEEVFARTVGWMKTTRINFPPPDRFASLFEPRGFSEEVRPLWGRTPFNSHLWVYRA